MRRNHRPLTLAALTFALAAGACGSDDFLVAADDFTQSSAVGVANGGSDHETIDPIIDGTLVLPDGWFEMWGYGTVLHVEGDDITPHYLTQSTCVVGEPFDNELAVDHASDDGTITVDVVGPTTDYELRPLIDALDCELFDNDRVDGLDEVFTTHYPFFAERGIDWNEQITSIRAASATDPSNFEPALAEFMTSLADGHTTLEGLDIDPDFDAFDMNGVRTIEDAEAAVVDEFDATLDRLEDFRTDPTGVIGWGHLVTGEGLGHSTGGIGYLFIGGFEGDEDDVVVDRGALTAAMDTAITDLSARFDELIVDVRFNSGGHEDLAVDAAGYFVAEPAAAYRKWPHAQPDPAVHVIEVTPRSAHFAGDVVVLTSPLTASAAEVFTLAMTEVAGVTVVGNPSFGEFSDAIDWVLPDGTEFTMSMEVYTDLDGNNYEAVGVPVAIATPFDRTLEAAIDHFETTR